MIPTTHAKDSFYLWAKTDRKARNAWHPLLYHSLDTLAVAEILWDWGLSAEERKTFAESIGLDEPEAKKWWCLFAALHDIGKISPPFQFLDAAPAIVLKALRKLGLKRVKGAPYHHGQATAAILSHLLPHIFNIPVDTHSRFFDDLAQTLGGHHGTFPETAYQQNVTESMDPAVEHPAWGELRLRFLEQLFDLACVDPDELGPTLAGELKLPPSTWVLFAGFVTVSDWIASNEDFFAFCPDDSRSPEEYLEQAREKARNALLEIGWSGWKAPQQDTRSFEQIFPQMGSDARPRPIQEWALTALADLQFAIIEAPMGEGKTEAALIILDRLVSANSLRGGYFALPTMATSNQMFDRVGSFLENWASGLRVNLHLLHGKALFSDAYKALQQRAINQDGVDPDEGPLVADEWFRRPKRGLLSPFAVGTVDQALMACLQTRHFFVRLFGLTGKVLIFDEVHAYDAYMLTLFEHLLTWLGRLGTRVIILSATLPATTREKLFRAYAWGKDLHLEHEPYPRISWLGKDAVVRCKTFETAMNPTYGLAWRSSDPAQRAAELERLLSKGGKALWICNSVRKAQEVYEVLKETLAPKGIDVSLFHARFPLRQRLEIEKETLEIFGKDPEYPGQPRVLVATQVVEQSLDLDFDLMISELAPIDLILQRIGRLHRHHRPRPEALEEPTLLLLEPDKDENGLPQLERSVYDTYILLRSWWVLQDCSSISLPEDMDELIESVYGDEKRRSMSPLFIARLEEALSKSAKARNDHVSKGEKAVIPQPHKRSVLEAFNATLLEDRPEAAQALKARTRLSGPSVSIVCLHEVNGCTCLDPTGLHPIDLHQTPQTTEEIRPLIENSASLSFPSVISLFPETMTPETWRRSSLLRHHRCVVFQEGVFETASGEMTLLLDPAKGLISVWTKGEKQDESRLQSDQ